MGSHAQRTALPTLLGIAVCLATSGALPAASPTGVAAGTNETQVHELPRVVPRLDGGITGLLRARLISGFNLAARQLQEVEGCALMFGSLEHNGLEMLRNTRYAPAEASIVTDACSRTGVVAYTAVGSPATSVCPRFERLSPNTAAMVLLHEALHYAGLRESPAYRDGPRTAEINALVRRHCGL